MEGGGRRQLEQTRGRAGPAGYRCIFNTETKRYNPRLIGKLHLPASLSPSLSDTNRGGEISRLLPPPFRLPKTAAPRICFRWRQRSGDSSGRVVYARNK